MTEPAGSEVSPIFVSPEEVGQMFRMPRTWVYEQLAAGLLPSVKLGRRRRISVAAAQEFAERLQREA